MKFYRYIIYRLYVWRLKRKDNTPATTVVITMSILHSFQLLILHTILTTFIPKLREPLSVTKTSFGIFIAIFFGVYYFFGYKREKWDRYVEEFKNESEKQKRKGTYLLLLFTIGTLVLTYISAFLLGQFFW